MTKIFLSSTFSDLKEHRVAVRNSIWQLGATDVSMENFGARDEQPAEECIRLVKKESDVFVGVYAHRYGHIPDGSLISISEMEYNAASELNLPRFIYLIDDNFPVILANVDQGEMGEKLKSFKSSLLKRHICQKFEDPNHLASRVAADLGRHIAMTNATKVGPDIAPLPLPHIGLESAHSAAPETPDEWNLKRQGIYAGSRNLFLSHVIRPSTKPGQKFDVFIYLVRHESRAYPTDMSDVQFAEFFMGPYWANKIFPVFQQNGFIGVSTSAYGTFLCLCRVTFDDGSKADLHRYIDFEAQRTGGSAG